ncbi:MAG: ATP-binding cassette domain-containing protein [Alicyclobacillus macrosporangiidus]|uniref:ATP-binding cassette domain-containing protein n=1 Tax=Alicyclobacillus macrosporangiidus TaxID=392015 RepID=UPI0026EB8E4D|nr:ATP-binding cassette domain-containing protein [Alicyclobacillus macrosporangiidus]MCL6599044.1 ATP-binding cassette domain-containing protein [Alicyclobacillus macrosporangiidus]
MALEARALTVTTASGRTLLNTVTCRAEAGDLVVIAGPVGAGKSTLLHALAGLVRPSEGEVCCDGEPLWRGRRPDVRVLRRIGVVFQSPEQQLFARDVAAEFRYSLRPYRLSAAESAQRTRTALARLGLGDDFLPRAPLSLSGGQRRRVAVATSFAPNPDWLLFDEPTAGMDPAAAQRFLDTLKSLREERRSRGRGGLLIATHDLEAFLPVADRVWVVAEGRLTADVDPAGLWTDPRPLLDAGLTPPPGFTLGRALAAYGVRLPAGPLSAKEAAAAIADQWPGVKRQASMAGAKPSPAPAAVKSGPAPSAATPSPAPSAAKSGPAPSAAEEPWEHPVRRARPEGPQSAHSRPPAPAAPALVPAPRPLLQTAWRRLLRPGPTGTARVLQGLDARAKWAGYALLTAGVMVQSQPAGLIAATGIAAILSAVANVSLGTLWRWTRPILGLTLFSAALSGIRFGQAGPLGLGFNPAGAARTLATLYRVVLMVWLSGLLSWTTTALELRQALEQVLGRLPGLRRPAAVLSLAASLIMRFIPVIGDQLDRFSRIARARAKSPAPPGRIRPRDLPAVTVPLLAALFQIAEDLSLAMEARGYSQLQPLAPAERGTVRWSRRDWAAIAITLAITAGLILLR